MTGKCYLVGAGPGDPGLLTVKGRGWLAKADVLVYDALSSAEFLHWLPKGCEKIFAGKRAADHAIPQEGINALIVEKAKEGFFAWLLPMIRSRRLNFSHRSCASCQSCAQSKKCFAKGNAMCWHLLRR